MQGTWLTPRASEGKPTQVVFICASVKTVHLSAQNNVTAVETEIELGSHVGICVVGYHCLVVHDHSRPVNVL